MMERCDKPYAVVRFDNNTYSEIPVLWLSDDELSCWWPKCQNPCSLMLKNIPPNSNQIEWSKYNVVVECFTATLDSARKKAEHSDYTSADDDFMAKGRGKRKKRPKVISDSDSSEYDDPDQPPSIVAYKRKIENIKSTKQIETSDNQVFLNDSAVNNDLAETILVNSPKHNETIINNEIQLLNKKTVPSGKFLDVAEHVTSPQNKDRVISNENKVRNKKAIIASGNSSPNTAERLNNYGLITCNESSSTVTASSVSSSSISKDYTKLDDILQTVNTVKLYVKSIDNRLQHLEEKQKSASMEMNPVQKMLPIHNLEELNDLESLLSDELVQNQYRNFLNVIGGRDARDNLQRILKRSFSNELACKCSWLGLRNNIKVCDLKIMKSIKAYILSNFADFRENNFEKVASEWFRLSKLRLSREKKPGEGDESN